MAVQALTHKPNGDTAKHDHENADRDVVRLPGLLRTALGDKLSRSIGIRGTTRGRKSGGAERWRQKRSA